VLTLTSSLFEDNTTTVAPNTASNNPIASRNLNRSFSISGARITLETSVVVPNGAMVEAGANPYAAQKCYN
jgi:hypothetical protein